MDKNKARQKLYITLGGVAGLVLAALVAGFLTIGPDYQEGFSIGLFFGFLPILSASGLWCGYLASKLHDD